MIQLLPEQIEALSEVQQACAEADQYPTYRTKLSKIELLQWFWDFRKSEDPLDLSHECNVQRIASCIIMYAE